MLLYDTMTMVGMIEALDRPRRFIFDYFFGAGEITFDTEEILFDKINSSRKIAPYVSPFVPGKAQALRGSVATTFKPAYVKPKAVISPSAVIKRRPGEALLGTMSQEERFNRILVQELEDQDAQIARREELMAIEILRTGKLVVESENYPKMTIDFGRDAGLTLTLTGADRWGETGVVPSTNLNAWAQLVHDASGAHPGVVVMDPKAAGLFLKDETMTKILDNRRQAGGELQLFGMNTGAQGMEAVRLGAIGQFEFWQYQQTYTDAAGATQKMLPDYSVIMGSTGIEGYACYGAIHDLDALTAVTRFPKMWQENDPSLAVAMTQSAPLPVPARPDGSIFIKVR